MELVAPLEIHPPQWHHDSVCGETDPDAFFGEQGESPAKAKAVCARCPVTGECLDYALTSQIPFGIWGGLTEDERRKYTGRQRRQQRQGVAA